MQGENLHRESAARLAKGEMDAQRDARGHRLTAERGGPKGCAANGVERGPVEQLTSARQDRRGSDRPDVVDPRLDQHRRLVAPASSRCWIGRSDRPPRPGGPIDESRPGPVGRSREIGKPLLPAAGGGADVAPRSGRGARAAIDRRLLETGCALRHPEDRRRLGLCSIDRPSRCALGSQRRRWASRIRGFRGLGRRRGRWAHDCFELE